MYADDLGALISGRHVTTIVHQVLELMKMFGILSGLLLNMDKCGIVVKGSLSTSDKQHLETIPQGELLHAIMIHDHIRYLGVKIGSISSDPAFAMPLGEAQRRASMVASLALSKKEAIILLKT